MRGGMKRRLMLGAAGVLMSLVIAGPAAAAGNGHGTVDVNDVTTGTHGGLVEGSDGNERNLQYYNRTNPAGPNSANVQGAVLYEEAVEFNSDLGSSVRVSYYDEKYSHPYDNVGGAPLDPLHNR